MKIEQGDIYKVPANHEWYDGIQEYVFVTDISNGMISYTIVAPELMKVQRHGFYHDIETFYAWMEEYDIKRVEDPEIITIVKMVMI